LYREEKEKGTEGFIKELVFSRKRRQQRTKGFYILPVIIAKRIYDRKRKDIKIVTEVS